MTPATQASSSFEAAGVHVRVVRALDLLAVVDEALFPPLHRHVRPLFAQGSRRRDRDHFVEPLLGADLVEERDLGHADRGRTRKLRQLLAPVQVLRRDARVEQAFEPGERLPVAKDALAHLGAVDHTVLVEDSVAETLEHRRFDLGIGANQVVDDLVARDHGGAVPRESLQRLALPRPDAAGDGDRDWSGYCSSVSSG